MKRAAGWMLLAALASQAQIKLPPVTRGALGNGLPVILAARKDVPMITVRLLVRGGAESDPAGMAGLSDVTAELLRRGAGQRTAEQFAADVDALGAEFSTASDPQATTISMEFLAKDAAAALELMADAVLRPSFASGEVKKELAEQIDGAKAAKDSPGAALRRYLPGLVFGAAHPYGRVADELTLGRINSEAIQAHHRRYYVARNMILVAAGDMDAQRFRAQLETAFGALPPGEAYAWVKDAPGVQSAKPRLLLVDKPDATQTNFAIAMPGIHRAHPDRTVLWLVNTLFGDRFTSMLNDELRVNSGLTYGANSRVQLNRLPGAIVLASFTKNDTTVPAIDLALDVLRRLRTRGIDAAQLASAKAYVKGIFPTENLETDPQIAEVLGEIELFGLGRGEIDDLIARIDAVTPEQATAAARKYYVVENLQFCLVGKASEIREKVAKYATAMQVIPITGAGFAVPEF